MRGTPDHDIMDANTGETYGQYRRREELKGYKPIIEWFAVAVASILIIAISFTAF